MSAMHIPPVAEYQTSRRVVRQIGQQHPALRPNLKGCLYPHGDALILIATLVSCAVTLPLAFCSASQKLLAVVIDAARRCPSAALMQSALAWLAAWGTGSRVPVGHCHIQQRTRWPKQSTWLRSSMSDRQRAGWKSVTISKGGSDPDRWLAQLMRCYVSAS